MERRTMRRAGILIVMTCLVAATTALALITRPLPLKVVVKDATYICTAKIEKLDPDRPSAVLAVDGDLKGKSPFRSIPMLLKGDSESEKQKQSPEIVKRLPKDTPLVLFISDKKDRQIGFAYSNGTWFQFLGEKDGESYRWGYTHAEPYLRRTFKGTTAEMKQTVEDALSNKKEPPEPNLEEKPGLGPEPKPMGSRWSPGIGAPGSPLFAVIPTAVVGAPLAILGMFFPALFGGLMIVLRRWKVLLAVVSINSTLFLLHTWFDQSIQDYWWGSRSFLWTVLTAIALIGAVWAWRRSLLSRSTNVADQLPTKVEMWALGIL